jgi:hypothetical protein
MRRGRKKEKTQISVRIDKAVMDLAYRHIGNNKLRITDFMERGLILAMQEALKLTQIASQVRFMVLHATRDSLEMVEALLALIAIPQVAELDPAWTLEREFILNWLKRFKQLIPAKQYEQARAAYGYQPAEPEEPR